MARVEAVKCDACDHIEVPELDGGSPFGWLIVDIYREGEGNLEARTYCSWACLADVARDRATPTPNKRKRRSKAEIMADRQAAKDAAAQRESEAVDRSLGVPPA